MFKETVLEHKNLLLLILAIAFIWMDGFARLLIAIVAASLILGSPLLAHQKPHWLHITAAILIVGSTLAVILV